jgi:hypothetical protein
MLGAHCFVKSFALVRTKFAVFVCVSPIKHFQLLLLRCLQFRFAYGTIFVSPGSVAAWAEARAE